jgi:predicted nuclease of restriction endonuclease-like RecB superfamily
LLTADLVEVRRRGDQLFLRPLEELERQDAVALAETYVGLVQAHVGRTRGQLLEACRTLPVAAQRRRLAAALWKLAMDQCHFEEVADLEPPALRAALFAEATRRRKALGPRESFDREAVVTAVATQRGLQPDTLEQGLYADLPEAQVLKEAQLPGPRALVAAYEEGGVQAVLLRAVSVRVRVLGASAAAYRSLFRKLKFLRLLHQIEPIAPAKKTAPSPGYELIIDGPYSLFDSVTRYGLALALAYPAIAACGRFTLEAELRWGKERRPMRFVQKGEGDGGLAGDDLPEEVTQLLAELERQSKEDGAFHAAPSARLISLPGAGVIAPDLELRHKKSGRTVQLEVLGFWSRDAVWKRIELAEAGLPEPMIFAVSKHLRVSEAALPEEHAAALYVYAHKMSARAVLERAKKLIGARPARV